MAVSKNLGATEGTSITQIGIEEIKQKLGLVRGSGNWDRPYQWLIEGLIPDKSIGFLGGPSSSGKTFVGIELFGSVALGSSFLNTLKVPEDKSGAILYCATEGQQGLDHRFEAWRQTRNVDRDLWNNKIYRFDKPFTFKNITSEYFSKTVKALEIHYGVKFKLIIFDTFINYGGIPNENASSDVQQAIAWMKEVIAQTDVSVLGVHHTGKNDVEIGCDFNSLLRGSSDLGASAEFVIGVVKSNEESNYDVSVAGVWPSKLKDKKTVKPMPVKIASYGLKLSCGQIEDVGTVTTLSKEFEFTKANNKTSIGEESEKIIINILKDLGKPTAEKELQRLFVEETSVEENSIKSESVKKRFKRAFNSLRNKSQLTACENSYWTVVV